MDEQTHTTNENVSNQAEEQKGIENSNAEQTKSEENRQSSGKEIDGQVDFSQMYDMLTERDATIKDLQSKVAELKKTNTGLLMKVNASAKAGETIKNPYEKFVDLMGTR